MLALGAAALGLLAATGLAHASLPDGRPNANVRPLPRLPKVEAPEQLFSRTGEALPPTNTTYYFQQIKDHNNPSLGTFTQRYWSTWEFYEPGGCIVLFNAGEGNAEGYDGYLTNKTWNGQLAQQEKCATIVVEHRYYGESNPTKDLSVASLRWHTLQQAIDDMVYFAEHVVLPMPGGANVKPDRTPWVFVGGSYSGALASYIMTNTNTFYAAYSSSGVVQTIERFWGYFEPIRENMPQNCSADVQKVIAHVDWTFSFGTKKQKQALKATFGLGDLAHLDDVAGALRNNLWSWQSLQPYTGAGSSFYKFCDALEVKDGKNAPVSGWGLDHALAAWGKYWTSTYLDSICDGVGIEECLGTYNATQEYYTDTSLDQAYRSWEWIVCNEVGFFQDGAPLIVPTLVSRLIPPPYDLRQCAYYFPEAYKKGVYDPRTTQTNSKYKGWAVREQNLFFATGVNDPWREATVSANGLHFPNTTAQPVGLSRGFHCSDLLTRAGTADATVLAVQRQGLAAMKRWLAKFPRKAARMIGA